MNEAVFDTIAGNYDSVFTNSLIGREQRKLTRQLLDHFLAGKPELDILEINCGTGDDAIWLAAKGHRVTATDISTAMIHEAEKKSNSPANPRFLCAGFNGLETLFQFQQFDFIFSNFSGLNCVAPEELEQISIQLNCLLKPGGHLAIVIFGKYSWWETFIFLVKGKPRQSFRRWTNRKLMAPLAQDVYQPVYYHSVKRIRKIFGALRLIEKKPVGLFIPPSYLEASIQKHPHFFRSLVKMENRASNLRFMSSFADHVWMLLKK